MKKFVLFSIAGIMVMLLAACGKNEVDKLETITPTVKSDVPATDSAHASHSEVVSTSSAASNSKTTAKPTDHASSEASPLAELPSGFPAALMVHDVQPYSSVTTADAEIIVLTSNQELPAMKEAYRAAVEKANMTDVEEATQSLDSWGITGNLDGKPITIAITPDPTGLAQTAITIKRIKY